MIIELRKYNEVGALLIEKDATRLHKHICHWYRGWEVSVAMAAVRMGRRGQRYKHETWGRWWCSGSIMSGSLACTWNDYQLHTSKFHPLPTHQFDSPPLHELGNVPFVSLAPPDCPVPGASPSLS